MIRKILSYGMANIISALIGFVVVPILARQMGPAAFGKAAIFVSVVWVCNAIICLNLTALFNVKFKKMEKQEFARFLSTAGGIILIHGIVAAVVLIIFESEITELSGLELPILLLALVGSQFNIYFQLFQSYQMMRGQAYYYGVLQVLNAALTAGLSVILVYQISDPLDGRVFGLFIPYFLLGLFGAMALRRAGLLSLMFDKKWVPDIYKFCLPLLPHMGGVALFAVVDRFLALNLAGEERAGIYLGAVTLAAVAGLVITAVNRTMVPHIFDILTNFDETSFTKILKLYGIYILVSVIAVPPIYLLSDLAASLLLGQSFAGAGSYLSWLLFGQLLFGCYTLGSNILMYFEKTALLSTITLATGGINVALIYTGFAMFGLLGFVYAFAIAMFLRFAIVTIIALRKLRAVQLETAAQ